MRDRIRADRHGQDDPLSDTSTAATYWSEYYTKEK